MNKTELEEKIKNGESVWCLYQSHKEIEEMYFSKENKYKFMEVKYIDGGTELCLVVNYDWYYPLKYLFKTKAEAEHYLHHANVTRTETLPFLTWEDIVIKMKNMESFGLNRNDRVLARIITKDSIYYFKLCKSLDLFTFQLKEIYIGNDLCEEIKSRFPISLGKATEENFYKAYDECVRLFRGGE